MAGRYPVDGGRWGKLLIGLRGTRVAALALAGAAGTNGFGLLLIVGLLGSVLLTVGGVVSSRYIPAPLVLWFAGGAALASVTLLVVMLWDQGPGGDC